MIMTVACMVTKFSTTIQNTAAARLGGSRYLARNPNHARTRLHCREATERLRRFIVTRGRPNDGPSIILILLFRPLRSISTRQGKGNTENTRVAIPQTRVFLSHMQSNWQHKLSKGILEISGLQLDLDHVQDERRL